MQKLQRGFTSAWLRVIQLLHSVKNTVQIDLTYMRVTYALFLSAPSSLFLANRALKKNQPSPGMKGSDFSHYYTGNQQLTSAEDKVSIPK